MTNLRKATEMALKFCEDIGELSGPYPYVNETAIVSDSRKVLQALRQALAQPKQEPVAWMDKDGDVLPASVVDGKGLRNIPLYTAPPKREWAGLMKGVRVEGDKVIIATKDNDVARELCGKLIEEKNT